MRPGTRRKFSATDLFAAFILVICSSTHVCAEPSAANVLLGPPFPNQHRDEIAAKLRAITGWTDLRFDSQGRLRLGEREATAGSSAARRLLSRAVTGSDQIVLEDASGQTDVVFCQVVSQMSHPRVSRASVVRVVRIDFADFDQLLGDAIARRAFDVAWGLLHELDHVVNRSADKDELGGPGKCESNINAMRRELGLPERAEYFYTRFPTNGHADFKSRFVRLAFDRQISPNKKKRYWILWDAALVGGLPEHTQVASVQ